MRKKKILNWIVLISAIVALLWFFGFLTPRNYSFARECFKAKKSLEENFKVNKTGFYNLKSLVSGIPNLTFDIINNDTLYMKFRDTSIFDKVLWMDSTYDMSPETTSKYQINDNGCLEVINNDTIEVCNHSWEINFYGHYKDSRIIPLLNYYGLTRQAFDEIVTSVKSLNCKRLSINEGHFELEHKVVSYYNDGIFHCFGHTDGYFGYLYSTEPEKFIGAEYLEDYEDNFYLYHGWDFD